MPMDIRSFFKAKGAAASAKNKSKDTKAADILANSGEEKRITQSDKRDTSTSPAKKTEKKTTTKQLIIDDSSEEEHSPPQNSPVLSDRTKNSSQKRSAATANHEKNDRTEKAPEPCNVSPEKRSKVSTQSLRKHPSKNHNSNLTVQDLMYGESSEEEVISSPIKSRKRAPNENTDEDYQPSPKKTSVEATKKASPKSRKTPPSSTKKLKRDPPLKPSRTATSIDAESLEPECLKDYTFVCTGVLPTLSRDDCQELIKTLGGRVTSAVSGKTDYLIVGDVLEDGRPYTEGSKYKKALEKDVTIVQGEEQFYGLILQHDDKVRQERGPYPRQVASNAQSGMSDAEKQCEGLVSTSSAATELVKPPPSNSYTVANPYAKRSSSSNPYATKNPYASNRLSDASATSVKSLGSLSHDHATPASVTSASLNQLWVDKYKPSSTSDILGNADVARKLALWLERWEERFNNPKAYGRAFSNPQGPWKAALLSGPPGIGKTTTALVVADEAGRDVIEFNASDVRSKKSLSQDIGDVTGSRTLEFGSSGRRITEATRKKRVIIMDEVDGMGGGDRGGMAELIQLIKHSRVPIICICNDRQNQKMKSLIPYCMDLRCRRPVKTVIAKRAIEIARREGMMVEQNAAEAIAESCGNDVRQVINCIQMWANCNQGSNTMTYKGVKEREKSTNKDEMLRVSLFDAAKMILEGPKGGDDQAHKDSFYKRNDAFFVDYNFVGLIVHQNYLKLLQHPYGEAKRANNKDELQNVLERMHAAADSMSDYAVAESALRGDQNWGLLPFTGMLTVKTGFHAAGETGGFLPGYPEFTTWLGRNSTKGKKARLLTELRHHTNFKVSGTMQELRSYYIPVLHEKIISALQKDGGVDEAIDIMDTYGLDREDVMEKFDEFVLDPKHPKFEKLDTKKKSEFTRIYNQRAHTSQALVAEQGAGKKAKRSKASGGGGELFDPDAIDDDAELDENTHGDDEEEDEMDEAKIKALFGKKKRGRTANTSKDQTSAAAKRSKKK